MELRDHPLMSYRGLRNWPPAWTWIGGKENTHPKGEVGILKELLVPAVDPPNRCFLIMEHKEAAYIGCLLFEDRSFCRQISNLLKNYYGYPIQYIGSLDLAYSP